MMKLQFKPTALRVLIVTLAIFSFVAKAAPQPIGCPAPGAPSGAKLFTALNPSVLRGLSKRTQALVAFKTNCSIDHRTERVKTNQNYTSFCHVHALAELWNNNVPESHHVDAYSLSLQAWLYQMGVETEKILDKEIEKFNKILDSYPYQMFLTTPGLSLLQDVVQSGRLETDFEMMQTQGFYTPANRPHDIIGLQVQILTDMYLLANRQVMARYPQGISDEFVRDTLRPIYEKIAHYAWSSDNQAEVRLELEPNKNVAASFNLITVAFKNDQASKEAFFRLLKQFPLGASTNQHAVVIAGYDEATEQFWIRDSSRAMSYYQKPAEVVFSQLRDYYYFTR